MKLKLRVLLAVVLFAGLCSAQPATEELSELFHLEQRWAEVNYQLKGKTQLTAFDQLLKEIEELSGKEPSSAEIWVWRGIIKSSYAQARGGLVALGLAKEAKADIEFAMGLDAEVLGGAAYMSLGALYHRVPGWPIGFGDDFKAGELLRKAVALNPESMDTNYFYGAYLLDAKRYDEAEKYLLKAKRAPVRPRLAVADSGRHREIDAALALLNRKR